MDFVEKIKNSIYNPTFYRNIPKESFGTAIKYYLLLCLLVTFFRLVFLSFPIAKSVNYAMHVGTTGILQVYPNNLQITIHSGTLAGNQPQPYTLPLCFDGNSCQDIIIDTKRPDVETYLKKNNVFMLLTKNTAYIKGDATSSRSYDLSQVGDMTINKGIVTNFFKQITPWTTFFVPVAIIFTGIMLYIGFLFKLLYIFFLALILWLLAKKFTPGMTYGQSYKVSLHVATLGILVALLLDVTSWFFHIYTFPFMETMFSVFIYIINFNNAGTTLEKKPKRSIKKK